jgi:hypothetical protein
MISQNQVRALTAQAAAAAAYPAYDTNDVLLDGWLLNDDGNPVYLGSAVSTRGVGIYGQTPESLELAGLLKPGATNLITSPALTITVLNTPAAWTGAYNINSLLDYLNAPTLQHTVQIALMESSYQALVSIGVLDETESARYQATFLQPTVRYGIGAVFTWLNGQASAELASNILIAARQGQYAIDFVDVYGDELLAGPDAPSTEFTTDRTVLDQIVTDIIGNSKIPSVDFGTYPDPAVELAQQIAAANAPGAVPVTIPTTTNEDGTLRFAPGQPKG